MVYFTLRQINRVGRCRLTEPPANFLFSGQRSVVTETSVNGNPMMHLHALIKHAHSYKTSLFIELDQAQHVLIEALLQRDASCIKKLINNQTTDSKWFFFWMNNNRVATGQRAKGDTVWSHGSVVKKLQTSVGLWVGTFLHTTVWHYNIIKRTNPTESPK